MATLIFVSLPVAELGASTAFYNALGFTQNLQFSDDASACMVWSETIHVMLLSHAKWRGFTDRRWPGRREPRAGSRLHGWPRPGRPG